MVFDGHCEPDPASWAKGEALTHGDVTRGRAQLGSKRPDGLQLQPGELLPENRAAPSARRRLCPFTASGGPSPYSLLDVANCSLTQPRGWRTPAPIRFADSGRTGLCPSPNSKFTHLLENHKFVLRTRAPVDLIFISVRIKEREGFGGKEEQSQHGEQRGDHSSPKPLVVARGCAPDSHPLPIQSRSRASDV